MVVVQSCSQSGATYGICCMVAETIFIICSEHSCRHGAPDLALMLCTCLGREQKVIVAPTILIHFVW